MSPLPPDPPPLPEQWPVIDAAELLADLEAFGDRLLNADGETVP